jgi:hypothetical protein
MEQVLGITTPFLYLIGLYASVSPNKNVSAANPSIHDTV